MAEISHTVSARLVVDSALGPLRSFSDILIDLAQADLSVDPVSVGDVMNVLLKSARRELYGLGQVVDEHLGGRAILRASPGHPTHDAGDVLGIVGGRDHACG